MIVQSVGTAFICAIVSDYLRQAGRVRGMKWCGPDLLSEEASDLQQTQRFVEPVNAEAIPASEDDSVK